MQKHKLRVLVVADLCVLPYKVLFCLRHAGVHDVYVLTNRRGSRLRYSRFCRRVFVTGIDFDGSDSERALGEINRHVAKLGIDAVIAGDQHSTRLLAMIQSRTAAPCFPLPDEARYNMLHNKWEFFRICREQGVLCPESAVFPDAATLAGQINAGAIRYPAICKPINLEAGNGILKITEGSALEQVRRIYYEPILVQQFIAGEDIGASVYCENGVIKNFVAHWFKRQLYHTFLDDGIYTAIGRIVGSLRVSGVFNFDMRRAPGGEVYFIECNPRFFAKMIMSALAGVNFAAAGLGLPTQAYAAHGKEVKMPRLFGFSLFTKPHKISGFDILTLLKLAADPIPFAGELFRAAWSDIDAPINYYLESKKDKAKLCDDFGALPSVAAQT